MSLARMIRIGLSPRGLVLLAVALLAVLTLPGPGGPTTPTEGHGLGTSGSLAAGGPAADAVADADPDHGGDHGGDHAGADGGRSRIASPFLQMSGRFILAALAFSQMFAVLRLVQGPTLADRVIALDFIGITCASMIGVYSVVVEEPLFLRAALVLSLMSFLGTIGFAMYCEKRGVP
jgi:multicomponent Na+:H+ antiporter subunit F